MTVDIMLKQSASKRDFHGDNHIKEILVEVILLHLQLCEHVEGARVAEEEGEREEGARPSRTSSGDCSAASDRSTHVGRAQRRADCCGDPYIKLFLTGILL